MHEAGIARAVAGAIRDQAAPDDLIRLFVTGGHGQPEDFDAALRLHLALALPDRDPAAFEIVHRPTSRLCPACAVTFDGIRPLDPCPTCGSPGLETPVSEEIDLEILPAPVGA